MNEWFILFSFVVLQTKIFIDLNCYIVREHIHIHSTASAYLYDLKVQRKYLYGSLKEDHKPYDNISEVNYNNSKPLNTS